MGGNQEVGIGSASRDAVRLVLLSDTHGMHRSVRAPEGDWLIHAGDFTVSKSWKEIVDFNAWLAELPHRVKILVPGNWEFWLEADLSKRSLLSNAAVPINERIQIEGLHIWGSPVTLLYGGAFGMSSAADRKRLYDQIPDDTDILITHGPSFGVLDCPPNSNLHVDCRELFDAVMRVKPRLHLFGHVHGAKGIVYTDSTIFVNAALLGPHGEIDKAPIVLRLSRRIK